MPNEVICTVVGFLCGIGLSLISIHAAYRNGCCDGYGYSKEPTCPGYAEAGKYLRETMAHRWPELTEEQP